MTGHTLQFSATTSPSRRWLFGVLLMLVLVAGPRAYAQSETGNDGSAFATITKQVLSDPTTYAPTAILYSSMKLDWNSSQPLFARGYLEQNRRYTVSGQSLDVPVSFREGNQRLLMDSLAVLPSSIANNAVNRVLQRSLTERHPEKRKLWATLAFIERMAFASYTSYVLSSPHFDQWQRNKQMMEQLAR